MSLCAAGIAQEEVIYPEYQEIDFELNKAQDQQDTAEILLLN